MKPEDVPPGPLLVDTNVFSWLAYQKGPFEAYARIVVGHELWLSWITVGELLAGAVRDNWSVEKRARLDAAIRKYGVIPGDIEVARAYGELKGMLGGTEELNDLWIAASAIGQTPSLPLVTGDSDYDRIAAVCTLVVVHADA